MIEYIKLFIIFFKVGLFTIGGGLSALPLLQSEAMNRHWVSESGFANMIAISQSTPGPIGINMATYVGFNQLGILGSLVATMGMVAPSIIIISIIARFLDHFNENKVVRSAFIGLRPAVIGIICAAAFSIALISVFNKSLYLQTHNWMDFFDLRAMVIFVTFIVLTNKWKQHPMVYILLAGVIGMIVF